MSDIRKELERLKTDFTGLLDVCGGLKDEVEDLKEENENLKTKLKTTKMPKGLSSTTIARIRRLESTVQQLTNEHLLDRQLVTNNLTAMLGLTKEFQQTVAANDH
ncbi:hypothetical protein [Bermanella sp. R86510]|uniref:hypothetical protein n=1 Tax=unclassified Bermanella TaxID=2627862 RepID=UPI0037C56BE6